MSTTMEMVMEMVPTKSQGYSYEAALAASQKVNWRVEDIIGGDTRLGFLKPFLARAPGRGGGVGFLSAVEKRIPNQTRGNSSLCLFGVVEEFILPFLMDHARPLLSGDDYRVRALLQFAGEEAKHIHLFKRFREEFDKGFS